MKDILSKIYISATAITRANKQTTGKNNDYYITLQQLEAILMELNSNPLKE